MRRAEVDAIVVGAGFAGAIIAERLASQRGARVLLFERRPHIAGNMFDHENGDGVLVHKYGPHIFRTDNERVLAYLGQFTEWNGYREHRVLASIDGQLVPVPFNLTSLRRLFPPDEAAALERLLVGRYGMEAKIPIGELRASDEPLLAALGKFVFEKIYLNYTVKQWGESPDRLDFATITQRVPVRVSFDDRYFQQGFQGLPLEGYTRLFERMLGHPKIEVRLGEDARRLFTLSPERHELCFEGEPFHGPVLYTGALDELFDTKLGALPYRSLDFVHRTLRVERAQQAAVINYPNEHPYTRITEFKQLTLQQCPGVTTLAEEHPCAFDPKGVRGAEPYYPIPKAETGALYQRYVELARAIPNLILLGRLAEYRYYDMNDIITRALTLFEERFATFTPA